MLKSFSTLTVTARCASLATQATHGKPIIAVSKLGPYALFLKENAAKQSTKINKGSISEFSKDTAAKWKKLSEDEKKKYATRAQEINNKAMADFMKKPEGERLKLEAEARDAKEKLAKKREIRERRENWEKTGHPKLPLSAYMHFMKEKLNAGPKVSKIEDSAARVKTYAAEWKGMNDSAKAKYVKMAEAEAAKYKTDVEKWKKSNPPENNASPTKTTPKKTM